MDGPADTLAAMLRLKLGGSVQGIGPDTAQLAEMWSDDNPAELRPAIDALEEKGFIRVQRKIATPHLGISDELGLRDIAGIIITERFQRYFDDLGL